MSVQLTYGDNEFDITTIDALTVTKTQSLAIAALPADTGFATLETQHQLAVYQDDPIVYSRDGSQVFCGIPDKATSFEFGVCELSFVSPLGKLTQVAHNGGVYSGTYAGDLIREICGDVPVVVDGVFEDIAVYGWLPYVSPNGEGGARAGSARDNLMQVLFSIGGNLWTTDDGKLLVTNLPTTTQAVIGADRVWMDDISVKTETPVTSLTLVEHQYSPDASAAEKTLFEGTSAANQTVVFSEPMSDLHAYAGGTEVQLTDSGANFAVLPLGVTMLVGKPYTHTLRELTETVSTTVRAYRITSTDYKLDYVRPYTSISLTKGATYYFFVAGYGYFSFTPTWESSTMTASGNVHEAEFRFANGQFVGGTAYFTAYPTATRGEAELHQGQVGADSTMKLRVIDRTDNYGYVDAPITTPNEVRIENATLIGFSNVSDVAARLVEYYKHRSTIHAVFDHQYETAGDVVSIVNPLDPSASLSACISSITIEESANPKATAEALIGFTPYQIVPFEDVRVVLASDGTFTVPAGVTSLRVVLIGGGQGGRAGRSGNPANVPTPYATTNTETGTITKSVVLASAQCTGGAGGEAGNAGSGGKVLILTLNVSEGDTFAAVIGAGGAGSTDPDVDGADGTATNFGDYSTASGESAEAGYYDPVAEATFATRGAAGVRGGDGAGRRDGADYTPAPIVVDGVSYTAGARDSTVLSDSKGQYNRNTGYYAALAQGGYGGGNAYKGNGAAGSAPDALQISSAYGYAYAYAAHGGDGADALAPPDETVYGKGGAGGNGGGGGGAYGWRCAVENTFADNLTGGTINVIVSAASAASGGAGSVGGKGGDGAIIIYYRRSAQNAP